MSNPFTFSEIIEVDLWLLVVPCVLNLVHSYTKFTMVYTLRCTVDATSMYYMYSCEASVHSCSIHTKLVFGYRVDLCILEYSCFLRQFSKGM